MTDPKPTSAAALLPLAVMVFAAFLAVGAAIPVLPLHVTGSLGMSTFVVGMVSGAQFAAALASRLWSGRFADRHGGKRALLIGLVVATNGGCLYLASLAAASIPVVSVSILTLGRAVLGAGEGFIVTGALSWAITCLGASSTGRVMSWVGMAMYVGYALGGPIGAALYTWQGFDAIAMATIVIPACTGLAALRLPAEPRGQPTAQHNDDQRVLGAVWLPGVALAFASLGFGALTTFAPLVLRHTGWGPTWSAFSVFSLAFVLARALFGHLPDRFGGARVAAVSVLVELVGQALAWQAGGLPSMLFGSALTGFGYSLVYPALGVEAVKRAPARLRALAMGTYTAFLDLMLGVGGPVLGLVAAHAGLQTVFAVGTAAATCSAAFTVLLRIDGFRQQPAKAIA